MSYLFWYKILFMTELLIAEGMFVIRFPKRRLFVLRLIGSLIVCYCVAIFYPIKEYTWYFSSGMFLCLFLITIIALCFCFKTPFINMLFCAATAYTVQHFSYEVFSFVNITLLDSSAFISNAYGSELFSFSSINGLSAVAFIIYLFIYVCIYLLSKIILHKRIGQSTSLKFKSVSIIALTIFAFMINVILSAIIQYSNLPSVKFYDSINCIYNLLCCITIFYIQVSMIKTNDMENEMTVLSELFRQYQKHYKIQKESISLINQKCHDFKHQIRTFASCQGVNKNATEELQNLISIYDTNIKTGNDALDIILMEKSLICHEKSITFTCIADGKSISFMKEEDLYALFGNILDNAIEAVSGVTNQKKRCINFHLDKKGQLIVIRTDNYFVGKIIIESDGLPKTTKGDEQYHGFGMKSIRALAEKYQGCLYVKSSDDMFRLSILIPQNEKQNII